MKKKSFIIAEASGHGKVIADIAVKTNEYDKIVFFDDNQIGDYVVISVGSHLAGTTRIGEHTWIDAVVVKIIEKQGVYVEVPANRRR